MMRKLILITALAAFPVVGFSGQAKAEEYCREYTKTVTVGGKREQAYGTACYRPDGSWEVVNLEGSDYGRNQVRDVMYDDLRHDYRRNPYREVVVVERHNRPYYPRYRQASYYSPFIINFGFGDRDHDRHNKKYYKKAKYNNHGYYHGKGQRKHHGHR